jgi:dipeptidyl aminopeptidase/acylaminoacyl peptidase
VKLKRHLLLTACLLLAALPPRAAAQTGALPIEEALRALTLRGDCAPALSPDGAWLAYTLQDDARRNASADERYHWFSPRGVSSLIGEGNDLWVTRVDTGESRQLTAGKGTNWNPVWSPDGERLAFYSDRDGAARLWVWEKRDGRLRRVSGLIVRPFDQSDAAQWTPDGRYLLTKALPGDTTLEAAARAMTGDALKLADERPAGSQATVTVYRSAPAAKRIAAGDERFHPSLGVGLFNRWRADLALVEVASGQARVIARDIHPQGVRLAPDGRHAAFAQTKWLGARPAENRFDLIVVSLADLRAHAAASDLTNFYWGTGFSWSPDGRQLSWNAETANGHSRCVVFDLNGGERRVIEFPARVGVPRPPLWDGAGETIYLPAQQAVWRVKIAARSATELVKLTDRTLTEIVAPEHGGRFWSPDGGRSLLLMTRDQASLSSGFQRLDLTTGQLSQWREERKRYGDATTIACSADGRRAVYLAEDARRPPDFWLLQNGGGQPRQITHTNPQLERYAAGESRLIEWQTEDGRRLRGALLLPAGYQSGRRYPLIVWVYGGASLSRNVNQYGLESKGVWNMQLFASRGYAVLLPDAPTRGSDTLRDLARAVLPGVDKAIELGIADPERLGLGGHSFGGYSTLALLVQTTRFKAAVCSAGFGNLFGAYAALGEDGEAYGTYWYEQGPHALGGSPWTAREKYVENSPFFHLDTVRTPLLLLHGARDESVPPHLPAEIFVGLRRLGRQVVYAKYEREGHVPARWGYANQLDYCRRMVGWFEEHLKADR